MRPIPNPFAPTKKAAVPTLLGLGCAWLLASASANAGPATDKNTVEQAAPPSLDTLTLDESYVFPSPVKFGNYNLGAQSENHALIDYTRRIQLNGAWYLTMGVHYEAFDFGGSNPPAVLPGSLQDIDIPLGISYMVDDHEGFEARIHPGVYFEHHIDSGAFDIPFDLGTYIPLKKDKLYWVVGLGTSILRQYPVIPTVGIIWVINKDWQLMAYLPEPKLVYHVSEDLTTWVGGEVIGESFKTDSNNFSPAGQTTSGSVVDYTEVRAGIGMTYTPLKHWDINLAAGYSVVRDFDFYRANKAFEADPAPYARLQLSGAF
jgi:hypothetical protein